MALARGDAAPLPSPAEADAAAATAADDTPPAAPPVPAAGEGAAWSTEGVRARSTWSCPRDPAAGALAAEPAAAASPGPVVLRRRPVAKPSRARPAPAPAAAAELEAES